MYSQSDKIAWKAADPENITLEDHIKNGLYCKSGFSFQYNEEEVDENIGRCATVDHVRFDGKMIQPPYECDPTDNEKRC